MDAMLALMKEAQLTCQQLSASRTSLRIAIVTETYPPEINGVALTISRMIEGLRARQHQIQLIRPRQDRDDIPSNANGLEELLYRGVSIPRYDSLKMGLPAKRALTRLWTFRRPDIVHVVTEGPLGWSAVKVAEKMRIPCSSDFHTNFQSYSGYYGIGWLRPPIAAYLRKFHNKAGSTIVPTRALRDELALGGYRGLRVVARGVDTRLFHPAKRSDALRKSWKVERGQLVAIHVGRLAPEKNLGTIIRAYQQMKHRCSGIRLVMVGDGPERGALEAAHSDIVFAGMRSGEDLARHYASGDIFLFSSMTETFGNVTVEAMASGLAVVAYNYAAASEHIVHGRNGWLADFGDPEHFSSLAVNAADPAMSATVGRKARKSAEAFDWDSVNDAFESALNDVVANHRTTGTEHLYSCA